MAQAFKTLDVIAGQALGFKAIVKMDSSLAISCLQLVPSEGRPTLERAEPAHQSGLVIRSDMNH
jgi:hypothetical protein